MEPGTNDASGTRPLTIVLVDDAPLVLESLAEIMDADSRLVLVGSATDPLDVDPLVSLAPDLALVDVRMPNGGGAEAARRFRDGSPATRVVALSAISTPTLRREMTEAGAVAYLTKGISGDDLLDQLVRIGTSSTTAD